MQAHASMDDLHPNVLFTVTALIDRCRKTDECACGHPAWIHVDYGNRPCHLPATQCPCVALRLGFDVKGRPFDLGAATVYRAQLDTH